MNGFWKPLHGPQRRGREARLWCSPGLAPKKDAGKCVSRNLKTLTLPFRFPCRVFPTQLPARWFTYSCFPFFVWALTPAWVNMRKSSAGM